MLTVYGTTGQAEYTREAHVGDLIYYNSADDNRRIVCKITALKSAPIKGVYGSFEILDVDGALPRSYADLFALPKPFDSGLIEVGTDVRGRTIKLPLNPFFHHVLVAGMTQQGKTHLLIVVTEEFLKLGVPTLVIDTQGDFIHLDEFSEKAIVVEELQVEELVEHLKQRRTVVYNLQGLPYHDKAKKTFEVLSQLMAWKERDYKQAENDSDALQIPPVLVIVDEAEIYAPAHNGPDSDPECRALLTDISKRGSKYGIGLIFASQRAPQLDLNVRSQCNSAVVFHVADDGSLQVLRQLPYVGSLELSKLRSFVQGQCMLGGQIAYDQPTTIFVREIRTRRAKNVDYEKLLGLGKSRSNAPEGSVTVSELSNRPTEAETIPCPDCGRPLVFRGKGSYECINDECGFIELKGGQAFRSAVIRGERAAENSVATATHA